MSCFSPSSCESVGAKDTFPSLLLEDALVSQRQAQRLMGSELLLSREGLSPDRCLMVGNDPLCDITGAKAAGMDAWYIRSGLTPRNVLPAGAAEAEFFQPGTDLRALRRALLSRD